MGVFGHSPPYFFRHGLSPNRNTMIPFVELVGCSVSPRDLSVSASAAVGFQGCDITPGILFGDEI